MRTTLLIGLDGATFAVLDPLIEAGLMPFLASLVSAGTRAELLSTPLPLTAQAWPAMTTGRSPSTTGITDFVRYHHGDGPGSFELTNSRDLRCETIWSLASRQGRSVTALNFYAMWPPTPVAGYTISSFVPWRHLKDAVYPPELYAAISRLPNFSRRELATDFEIERKCLEGMPPEGYEEWILFHIRRERQWLEILRHLMMTDPSNLTAIVFDGVDKIQHLCWRFLDDDLFPLHPSAWEERIRELCFDYFREVDSVIKEAVQLAGPESRIFIASDHGFGPTSEIFYVNEWLHQKGYLEWSEASTVDSTGRYSSRRLPENATQIDWTRTKAYAITSSSNGVWLRADGASRNGSDPGSKYESFREELANALLAYRDPATGQSVVTRVRMREDVYPGLGRDSAPDLLLTLRDNGFVSVLRADQIIKQRPQPVGTHRPEGVFIACGPGIRAGASHAPLSILDVAPTLLYSLGLPIPSDLEGQVPVGIFDTSYLRTDPPRKGAPTHATLYVPDENAPANRERDAEIIERLKALGYL